MDNVRCKGLSNDVLPLLSGWQKRKGWSWDCLFPLNLEWIFYICSREVNTECSSFIFWSYKEEENTGMVRWGGKERTRSCSPFSPSPHYLLIYLETLSLELSYSLRCCVPSSSSNAELLCVASFTTQAPFIFLLKWEVVRKFWTQLRLNIWEGVNRAATPGLTVEVSILKC